MKKIFSLLVILLISCNNKHDISIENLSLSFTTWYKKYSSDLSEKLISKDKNIKKFIGKEFNEDLKRFSIELNQINFTRLSHNKKNEYIVLKRILDQENFKYDKMKTFQWNLIQRLNQIASNIKVYTILKEMGELGQEENENLLEFITEDIIDVSRSIKFKYIDDINMDLLDGIIYDLGSLIDTLEVVNLQYEFDELKLWLKQDYSKYRYKDKGSYKSNIEQLLKLSVNKNFNIDDEIKKAEYLINFYTKQVFDMSLPIYMTINDEPIWTDFQDTLNVVNWISSSTGKFSNSFSNCINKDYIIAYNNAYLSKNTLLEKFPPINDVLFVNSTLVSDPVLIFRQDANILAVNYFEGDINHDEYFYILNDLMPGEFFISSFIRESDSKLANIYIDYSYLSLFKTLLINDYINFINDDLSVNIESNCVNLNKNLSFLLDFKLKKEKIKDTVGALAFLLYHYYNIPIENSIDKYDYFSFFDVKDIERLSIEILSLKTDSVIKFSTHYFLDRDLLI